MPKIHWYGPPTGRGSVDDVVSHTVEVYDALKKHSAEIASDARATLAMAYHRPEAERSYIGVIDAGESEFGWAPELDSTVYLAAPDDGGNGAFAAPTSIELGHFTKGDDPKWVPGLAPLRKAVKKAIANRRLSI